MEKRHQFGFLTATEIFVVIAIVAILVGIIIPNFEKQKFTGFFVPVQNIRHEVIQKGLDIGDLLQVEPREAVGMEGKIKFGTYKITGGDKTLGLIQARKLLYDGGLGDEFSIPVSDLTSLADMYIYTVFDEGTARQREVLLKFAGPEPAPPAPPPASLSTETPLPAPDK